MYPDLVAFKILLRCASFQGNFVPVQGGNNSRRVLLHRAKVSVVHGIRSIMGGPIGETEIKTHQVMAGPQSGIRCTAASSASSTGKRLRPCYHPCGTTASLHHRGLCAHQWLWRWLGSSGRQQEMQLTKKIYCLHPMGAHYVGRNSSLVVCCGACCAMFWLPP